MNKEEIIKKISETHDKEKIIPLRGKLISLIKKEIKQEKNSQVKASLKIELYNELKKHKETIRNTRNSNNKSIQIPKKLGLKIQEIATAIDIFKEKNDIITKIKNSSKSTLISGLIIGATTMGITLLTGGTISLLTITSLLPTISYIGLSNLLKMPFEETPDLKIIKTYESKDENSKKIMEFIDTNIKNNKEYIELLNKKRIQHNTEEKTIINEKLIEAMKKIINKAPNEEIKYCLTAELLSTMEELKKQYQNQKEDYINDKTKMTLKEFAELEKKTLQLDIDLFKTDNYIGDVIKGSLKNLKINTVVMYATRLCLGCIFPNFAFENVKDLVTPFIFSVINNITNMDKIRDRIKMKETKYKNKTIKIKNKEAFKSILATQRLELNRGRA